MNKKKIKQALKNNGVKGYSRAIITGAGWIIVGDHTGKIKNNILYLKPTDLTDKTSRNYAISL